MADFTTEGTIEKLSEEVTALKIALHLTLLKMGKHNVDLVSNELADFANQFGDNEYKQILLKVAKQLKG